MENKIVDNDTKITYTLVDGVYLPNLIYTGQNFEIGKWGKLHKKYLKECRSATYTSLIMNGKLNSHLHDVDVVATKMYDELLERFKDRAGITEQLKADDMMAWVQAMNNVSNCATEIVLSKIVYKP